LWPKIVISALGKHIEILGMANWELEISILKIFPSGDDAIYKNKLTLSFYENHLFLLKYICVFISIFSFWGHYDKNAYMFERQISE
jgi:hypothetical protein